jgi:hypothetical protein
MPLIPQRQEQQNRQAPTSQPACLHAAAAQEVAQGHTSTSTDIWLDDPALHKLQQGTMPQGITAAQRSRINQETRLLSLD